MPLPTFSASLRYQDWERLNPELVVATRTGRPRDKDNIRGRILLPAAARVDKLLKGEGRPPLPLGVSPHKLRHAFASILVACGEDPRLGDVSARARKPEFTLRTYAHIMRRGGERERLRLLVGSDWGPRSGWLCLRIAIQARQSRASTSRSPRPNRRSFFDPN